MSSAHRLFRLPASGRLGGVCAGIADYLDIDVTLVRLVWVVLSVVPGCFIGGAIAYGVAWMVMPVSGTITVVGPRKRLMRSTTDRKLGGVCGGIADYLSVDATVIRLVWAILTIFPGAIVLGIVAYLVAWFIMPERHGDAPMMPEPHTA
ncbi:MAG TPA: PspC domain-containing protein [Vicinamibacterales bacterium]|jgi:phage shock protein C|nr:PspC domain-containing protein [Vicinamibacterales bacterium]